MPQCTRCVTAGLTCEYRQSKWEKARDEPVANDASSGLQFVPVVVHLDLPGPSIERASSLGVEQSVAP